MKSIQHELILMSIGFLFMISGVSAFSSVSSTNSPKISLYTRPNSIHNGAINESSLSYRTSKQYNTRVNLTQRKASSLSISNFKRAKSIFTSRKKEKAYSHSPMQSSTKITSKAFFLNFSIIYHMFYLMNIVNSLLHLGSNHIQSTRIHTYITTKSHHWTTFQSTNRCIVRIIDKCLSTGYANRIIHLATFK